MAREIRLLLVEEGRARADLRRLLEGGPWGPVVEADYGSEAVARAREIRPDLILVGLNRDTSGPRGAEGGVPAARALRTIELLAAACPQAALVVVAGRDDRDLLRQAVRAGARDFLIRPDRETLRQALLAVLASEQRRRTLTAAAQTALHTAECVVVLGPRGGVGKTTLAVNLAVALVRETRSRVALVDLDLQLGDVALFLGLVPERTVVDLARQLEEHGPETLGGLLHHDRSGLAILPAPPHPEALADLNPALLQGLLQHLGQVFDYLVVDTAPVLDETLAVALEQATLALLLTAPELPALKRARVALDLLLASQTVPAGRLKVILNQPWPGRALPEETVVRALDQPVFWHLPYDPAASLALEAGRPCLDAHPRSRFSRSLTGLARALAGQPAASPRLARWRLFGR